MDRRFLTVLGVSLVFALVVSSIFYQMSARAGGGKKEGDQELKDVVIATKPLPVGVTIKPDDVKVIKVTGGGLPAGHFAKVEEVIDRPVASNILVDEPILEGRLAARGSGLGLAPIIPVGMRAVSMRVNEVVGVAGFVLPGMRVDVLVTGRPPEANGVMTTTCLQNILVLSAGQNIQPDTRGQAINAPVVTVLVTPEQAEILTLAGNEGKIQLVLRNANDQGISKTPGRQIGEIYRRGGPRVGGAVDEDEEEVADMPKRRRRTVVVAQAAPPPVPVVAPPPPPPPPDQVMVIRGTQKSVEVVSGSRAADAGRLQ